MDKPDKESRDLKWIKKKKYSKGIHLKYIKKYKECR